jgi:hypothetical protein
LLKKYLIYLKHHSFYTQNLCDESQTLKEFGG